MNLCLAIIESDGGPGFDGPPLFTARILNLYSQPSTRPSILPLILLPMASTSFTVNTLPSTHWPMFFSFCSMIAKHRFIPPHLLGDGIYDITLKK